MNKYHLYSLGGALLAASSLSSGTASAITVGQYSSAAPPVFTAGGVVVANTQFSATTAATANTITVGGGVSFGFSFANSFNATAPALNFRTDVTGAGGATFATTPTVKYLIRNVNGTGGLSTGSFTVGNATLNTATPPTISALNTRVTVSNLRLNSAAASLSTFNQITSLRIGGIILEGVTFNNASGLATTGAITLNGTLTTQGDATDVLESVAATAIITGGAPLVTAVQSSTQATASASTSPDLFVNFASPVAGSTSITLATVTITATGALGTDLTTLVATGTVAGGNAYQAAASGVILTVNSTALADTAVNGVTVVNGFGNTITALLNNGTFTRSNFASGSATFTISAAATSFYGTLSVVLSYNGTSAISSAAQGTVGVAYSAVSTDSTAPASASGFTAVVSRGGLSAEANFASNGLNPFQSYIRVHNAGGAGSVVTIVLKKDSDGSTIGTTTTANAAFTGMPTGGIVPSGGTIQIPVSQIETALGATPSGSYTVQVSGGFPGYIQHVLYNGSTGAYVDLSSFRNGIGTTEP